jgi:hypothetical protein
MKFFIVFDKSGDTIPFEVKYNHDLFEYFITKANSELQNSFSIGRDFYKETNQKITHLHWAISKTNEVFYDLFGSSFAEQTNLDNYLNQSFLNKVHSDWVFSHDRVLNIDSLRTSSNSTKAYFGNMLHEQYPDEIREIKTSPLLEKIGYIYPHREINMGIHRLEISFGNIEFKADNKWEVFANPFVDKMVTNNDVVNFSFGYTYVGRQYYNKFKFFDTELEYPDNYNYEDLEFDTLKEILDLCNDWQEMSDEENEEDKVGFDSSISSFSLFSSPFCMLFIYPFTDCPNTFICMYLALPFQFIELFK